MRQNQYHNQIVHVHGYNGQQSQALPALVNVFFPGLGQLIQGRVLAWLVWWLVLFISLLLCFVLIGFITTPILWLACIVESAVWKPRS